ncbi:MAG TPA: MMPL family transporter, partial [Ilumatobacteraceae bacterium]|nr:MMPL family transporter [Ilumatobacteraceae bacterium]
RRIMVFAIWLPLLIGISVISGGLGTDYHTDFKLPDSDSKIVQDALQNQGDKEDAGWVAQIVFTYPNGTNDPAVKSAMEPFFAKVDELDGVKVISPYTPDGESFNSTKLPISFAQINLTERSQSAVQKLADKIQDLGKAVQGPEGLRIEYGGQLFQPFELPESEILGVLAAVLILLIAFGSVLAMGLPIGTALFGLGVGAGVLGIVSNGFAMPEFSPQIAAMIGLGVGIDYALFIVTRYRENFHSGMDREEAVVQAVDSSGRAVVFAGITVMISLLGLFIIGLAFVRGLAVASALSVLIMMIAAITLLPALIGFAGRRVEETTRAAAVAVGAFVLLAMVGVFTGLALGAALGLAFVLAAVVMGISFLPFGRSLRKHLPHHHARPREQQFWYRWSRFIQRRPWPPLLIALTVLVLLALPLFSIRLGFGDTGNLKEDTTARQAYDLVAEGFGPGASSPLILLSTDPAVTAETAKLVDGVLATEQQQQQVAFFNPGIERSPGTWLWQVFPESSQQDKATSDLVHRLRDTELPATGLDVKVGGQTAASVDFATYLGERLPLLIGAVLILSFLLLMIVFRSILVPLKAVVMNVLSVGAAYGIIVAIFQWGWLKGLFGIGKAGPVEAWAPMMLFAITFGLSMDYEVFLLSRMKEAYDRTKDNAGAVADGLAVTARVITAAALIMVCVFSAFVLGDDRSLKLFGLGLAAAVLVDATVVRMVLVPATMELLGDRNWWIPKRLNKVLPRINVEGYHEDETERQPELV